LQFISSILFYYFPPQAPHQHRWIYDHGIPRYSSVGTFLGYIGSCTDIHERKAAREELEKLVAERTIALRHANINLEKSNEELKRFTYIASATDSQENFKETDLNILVDEIKKEFQETIAEKNATVYVEPLSKLSVIPFQFKQNAIEYYWQCIKVCKSYRRPHNNNYIFYHKCKRK
jgi:light-regulated signal transduction histidine kinase (bacteriophytochrome)